MSCDSIVGLCSIGELLLDVKEQLPVVVVMRCFNLVFKPPSEEDGGTTQLLCLGMYCEQLYVEAYLQSKCVLDLYILNALELVARIGTEAWES